MAIIKKNGILCLMVNRRSLVKTLLLGADLPHLDVKDPAAAAQGYVEDAARVDSKKYPAFVQGSTCENCLLLKGKEGESYRPCDLFPGKSVSAKGWCKGWSAEI